ncbi:26888_t:CDS:1, partial [Dentiscutata erythropus]
RIKSNSTPRVISDWKDLDKTYCRIVAEQPLYLVRGMLAEEE